MEQTVEALLHAALEPSDENRVLLAEKLWDSLDAIPTSELDRIWIAEAERRLASHRAGKITSMPAD